MRVGRVGRDWGRLGLADAQGLDSIRDPDRNDTDGEQTRNAGEDANERLDLVDAADDFALLAWSVGIDLSEEELFILIAGELSAIGEETNEEGGDDSPGDE